MIQYYCKSSFETPTTGFQDFIFNALCEDVHSQLWASQVVGANHHQYSSSIFTIQGNITGVMCKVVTPRDKERYPSPLTKQNAKGLGLYVGLSHLKTTKETQASIQGEKT